MLRATGRLAKRQAFLQIGVQRFSLDPNDVAGFGIGEFPVRQCRALLDTGAYRTALTNSFVLSAGLQSIGKTDVVTVGHEARHRVFLVNLAIYYDGAQDMPSSGPGSLRPFALGDPIEVMNMQDNIHFDAILGMDVLQNFDLVFRRNGSFILQLSPPLPYF